MSRYSRIVMYTLQSAMRCHIHAGVYAFFRTFGAVEVAWEGIRRSCVVCLCHRCLALVFYYLPSTVYAHPQLTPMPLISPPSSQPHFAPFRHLPPLSPSHPSGHVSQNATSNLLALQASDDWEGGICGFTVRFLWLCATMGMQVGLGLFWGLGDGKGSWVTKGGRVSRLHSASKAYVAPAQRDQAKKANREKEFRIRG